MTGLELDVVGVDPVDAMLDQFADDPDAWKLAFRYYASSGNYEQAAVSLKIAGYMSPLTEDERMTLGDLFLAVGVPAEASALVESSISR